jgi:hypothetical protein
MVDAARARLDAIENASERERLVREYAEKERRLRQELETAEAGYRKAASELAERRERDARERVADTKSGGPPVAITSPAPAGANTGSAPEIAARTRDDSEQLMKEQAAKAERERLASQVAAFEADKARLAEERRALELAMSERLAKAQAERERAEKRLAKETERLPVFALDQQRTIALPAAATPRRAASTCQEINARAQLGDISAADRDILQRGCR